MYFDKSVEGTLEQVHNPTVLQGVGELLDQVHLPELLDNLVLGDEELETCVEVIFQKLICLAVVQLYVFMILYQLRARRGTTVHRLAVYY